MKTAPAVSVVIPCYNSAGHIQQALDSVFLQTFSDFEVLLINDGSLDTEEFERALQPYLSRIRYLKQENGGPSAARNAGIRAARGEWIAFLDSDDIWLPEKLASQMRQIQDDASLDMVYSDLKIFGESPFAGKTLMEIYPPKYPVSLDALIAEDCQVPTTCVVASRRILLKAGLFDEHFSRAEDYDLWLRVAHAGGKIAFQRKVLAWHRSHAHELSADTEKMVASAIGVLKKLQAAPGLAPATRSLMQKRIRGFEASLELVRAKQYLRQGNIVQAIEALTKANAHQQRLKLYLVLLGLRVAPRLTARIATMRGS